MILPPGAELGDVTAWLSENKAWDKGISLSTLSGSVIPGNRKKGWKSEVEKGGEPMQECIMELINATGIWVFDSCGTAENPYEIHIRTIFLEQEGEIHPPTSMFLWSKLPTGQGGNSLYFWVVCVNFKEFFSRMSCTSGSKKPWAEVRDGIEAGTVCLYLYKAGWVYMKLVATTVAGNRDRDTRIWRHV